MANPPSAGIRMVPYGKCRHEDDMAGQSTCSSQENDQWRSNNGQLPKQVLLSMARIFNIFQDLVIMSKDPTEKDYNSISKAQNIPTDQSTFKVYFLNYQLTKMGKMCTIVSIMVGKTVSQMQNEDCM